ncbi:hypothetical protein [Williamsia phyllosphaerae]|nr:hypothetical protein [Williamsia phyllosphaerae]
MSTEQQKCPHCGNPIARTSRSSNTEWQATPNSLVKIGKLIYGGGGKSGPNGGTTYFDPPETR